MVGKGRPILHENLPESDQPPLQNDDFRSIFARSTLSVTPSEKKFN